MKLEEASRIMNSDVSQVAYPLFFYTSLVFVFMQEVMSSLWAKSWLSSLAMGQSCRLSAQKECSPHHQPVHSTLHYQHSTTTSQLFSKKKCCMASRTMEVLGSAKCCSLCKHTLIYARTCFLYWTSLDHVFINVLSCNLRHLFIQYCLTLFSEAVFCIIIISFTSIDMCTYNTIEVFL